MTRKSALFEQILSHTHSTADSLIYGSQIVHTKLVAHVRPESGQCVYIAIARLSVFNFATVFILYFIVRKARIHLSTVSNVRLFHFIFLLSFVPFLPAAVHTVLSLSFSLSLNSSKKLQQLLTNLEFFFLRQIRWRNGSDSNAISSGHFVPLSPHRTSTASRNNKTMRIYCGIT